MTPDVEVSPLQQGIDCTRLRERVTDDRVRDAMQSVMRHVFVREEVQMSAYLDVESPVGHGRRCPQPSVAALMVEAAEPAPGTQVAVLAAGTGYLSALLAQIGCEVTSVESNACLREAGAAAILQIGLASRVSWTAELGDGDAGRFDAIVVGAGVARPPRPWTAWLRPGGRLVVPVAQRRLAMLTVMGRDGSQVTRREVGVVPIHCLDRAPRT
jgi:protein-L-isoaspartate(D-aspartate) O-methyltransferase